MPSHIHPWMSAAYKQLFVFWFMHTLHRHGKLDPVNQHCLLLFPGIYIRAISLKSKRDLDNALFNV